MRNTRRTFLAGTFRSTVAAIIPVGPVFGLLPAALYAQGMGATDATGFLAVAPPLQTNPVNGVYARQVWIDNSASTAPPVSQTATTTASSITVPIGSVGSSVTNNTSGTVAFVALGSTISAPLAETATTSVTTISNPSTGTRTVIVINNTSGNTPYAQNGTAATVGGASTALPYGVPVSIGITPGGSLSFITASGSASLTVAYGVYAAMLYNVPVDVCYSAQTALSFITAAGSASLNVVVGLYNGLSPFPGYPMNGSGGTTDPYFQHGATGPSATANSAYGPVPNITPAIASATDNTLVGNQFFFAEGQSYVINAGLSWQFRGTANAAYPVCFQSYDSTDPLNTTKYGKAGTFGRGARPIWQQGTGAFPITTRGDARDYGGWIFRGIHAVGGSNVQFNFNYCNNNMLFENMVFEMVMLNLNNANPQAGYNISNNCIVRMCAGFNQYSIGAHAQGIFSASTNLIVEDSVYWHCGWLGTGRDDFTGSAGGPTIFNHCLYIDGTQQSDSTQTTSLIARRNVLIDGSASGLSLRGPHLVHHNVIIDCPTPEFKSGGSSSDTANPLGCFQYSYCQLVIGGADVNAGTPEMQGFSSSNGTNDSYHAHSLWANNPGKGVGNNNWLTVVNKVSGQPNYMGFFHNRAYSFAAASTRLNTGSVPPNGSLSSVTITADVDNVLFDTSPMTNAQLYAAIGFTDKSSMIAAMIADPSKGWAGKLQRAASIGFSFNFDHTINAISDLTSPG